MRFTLAILACGLLLTGCNERGASPAPYSNTPAPTQAAEREGGVKVRAPGVSVDVERKDREGDGKKDVNVDVKVKSKEQTSR